MSLDRLDRSRLRVLHVINGLGPGGSERSLAELLPRFIEDGVHPMVVCLKRRNQGLEGAIRKLGCEVRFLTAAGWPSRFRHLRAMVRTESIDLVHTSLFESDVLGRLAAAGTGIPVITSLVNTGYDPVRLADPNINRRRLRVVKWVDGWSARHLSAHFHAVTHSVKDDAVRALRLDPDRVTVIERGRDPVRLGAPTSDRRHQARRRLGLGERHEVIINIGRQEYQKGQRHLIEALEVLSTDRPNLVGLIVGREGHASPELQRLSGRLVSAGRLRYLGHREDVPDLLAAADVCVMPSLYEGCSGAAIEAMALGLPIIASDIPSFREVVSDGHNGILVPPGSVSDFAAAITHVLDDVATRAAFGHRSRERFLQRFTIDRSASRMIDLYRTVAAERTKPLSHRRIISSREQVPAHHG
jgi:glycosyltransferase involved in cell wall biosynthesis